MMNFSLFYAASTFICLLLNTCLHKQLLALLRMQSIHTRQFLSIVLEELVRRYEVELFKANIYAFVMNCDSPPCYYFNVSLHLFKNFMNSIEPCHLV